MVSYILQPNQIKIHFLGLSGISTVILTPTKGPSSTQTHSPSSQWWQQLRPPRRSDRLSAAGRKLWFSPVLQLTQEQRESALKIRYLSPPHF